MSETSRSLTLRVMDQHLDAGSPQSLDVQGPRLWDLESADTSEPGRFGIRQSVSGKPPSVAGLVCLALRSWNCRSPPLSSSNADRCALSKRDSSASCDFPSHAHRGILETDIAGRTTCRDNVSQKDHVQLS